MREGGLPLPPAFHYFILMTWKACYLDLVMVSSLASKWQGFRFEMLVFQLYEMKLKTSKFKALAFRGQWRYHDEIQITSFSCHKNQILKRLIHYVICKNVTLGLLGTIVYQLPLSLSDLSNIYRRPKLAHALIVDSIFRVSFIVEFLDSHTKFWQEICNQN